MTVSRVVITMRNALAEAVHERRPLPEWVLVHLRDSGRADAVKSLYAAVQHHTTGNTPAWHLEHRLEEILSRSLETK